VGFDFSQATERIGEYEGKRAHVYTDSVGHPTVGIGFNLDREGAADRLAELGLDFEKVKAGLEDLTDEHISALVKSDIEAALDKAGSAVGNFGSLSDARQFVVVDMIFNLGIGGFGHFHKAIAAIEAENWEEAGAQMKDSHWYSQVGPRAEKDVQMMISGDWA
jgi:GH24 family phage-related lysozyme (muramidase)